MLSLGVLGSFVPRDEVDAAVRRHGRDAKRAKGKLPPWSVVYLTMLMALFPDDDYEALARRVRLLVDWGRDEARQAASTAAVSQARERLGLEPVREVFERVAVPVADAATRQARWIDKHLVAVDGTDFDMEATLENVEFFGYAGSGVNRSGRPKARMVALVECVSRAPLAASIGAYQGKGSGERSLVTNLWSGLAPGMLCLADAGFYSWTTWAQASATGADLAWRIGEGLALPIVHELPDGSYLSVIINPALRGKVRAETLRLAKTAVLASLKAGTATSLSVDEFAALAGLDSSRARVVRVVEYEVTHPKTGQPLGDGQVICLITTMLDHRRYQGEAVGEVYHDRWNIETAFDQTEDFLPAREVLRSKKPDLVQAEIYGILLTQWAMAKLICDAATEADTSPKSIKYLRAVRIVRDHTAREADFSP